MGSFPLVPNRRFRFFAGAAVGLYWGALVGASMTKGAFWNLHLLWVYPLAGAAVWACLETDDRPDGVALWILILGALLPPVVPLVIFLTPPPSPPPPYHLDEGTGLGVLFALVWCGIAGVQVVSMTVVAWSLQGLARRWLRAPKRPREAAERTIQ